MKNKRIQLAKRRAISSFTLGIIFGLLAMGFIERDNKPTEFAEAKMYEEIQEYGTTVYLDKSTYEEYGYSEDSLFYLNGDYYNLELLDNAPAGIELEQVKISLGRTVYLESGKLY